MSVENSPEMSLTFTQSLVAKFMLLDDLLKGLIFGVGAVIVVILTAIFLIKIMLMSQEGREPEVEASHIDGKKELRSSAKSTSIASPAEEENPHAHLLSRKVIPLRSTTDYEEEIEISVVEED
ncbi:LAME_0B00474g1_1 [Lachancea meyersii CBS 8951]|uniref:LAME_0B00474g1_1 n=1 Tax=Lachancea meyersii CBS 8951 TaxID=1266667 RepID=A0A1G4ISJ1_9SACH|nr:LAME_0B00474g1_1 [Lachancea meyersii CBS 8951]